MRWFGYYINNDKYYCVNEYTTYCVNKTGFHCALPFRRFSSSLSSIFLSFSAPYYPASSCIFFFFFLYPWRSWTSYLSHRSCLPVILQHNYTTRFSWDLPSKISLFSIILDSLILQSITISSFICLSMFRAARKNAGDFLNILVPGEFRFFFIAFTWKLTRWQDKNRLTVRQNPFHRCKSRLRILFLDCWMLSM